MKKLLFLVFAFLHAFAALAQEEDFTADRPGGTTGPDVLPQKRLQVEYGVSYERNKIEDSHQWTFANTLFRYGLTKYAELRFQMDGQTVKSPEGTRTNIANVTIGTKVKMYDGYKAIPKVSLLGSLFIPGKDHPFLPPHLGGQMHLLFQNNLCSWLDLGYDAGVDWNGDSARPDVFLGACLGFTVTDNFGMYIEEFNSFNEENSSVLEVGASLQVHPRVQLDLSTDINLNHPSKIHNVMLGVAWQITK